MKTIAYCSPFVPPEWIAAHGMQPIWMRLRVDEKRSRAGAGRGVCPYAAAVIEEVLTGTEASAFVMTTTCDQMRYAAALLQREADRPIFLMNVPSTWQTAAARDLFVAELRRLGRFLVRLGGSPPTNEDLARVMLEYDEARDRLRVNRSQLSPREFAQAVAALRGNGRPSHESAFDEVPGTSCLNGPQSASHKRPQASIGRRPSPNNAHVHLAIVGGPLVEKDFVILDLIEEAGGRVVLDATAGGERTWPAPFDRRSFREDSLAQLAHAYFTAIPDVFRRPNDGFYHWLGQEVTARNVRGILFRRYVWCDIWHAELQRLAEWSPVPVLEIDVCNDADSLSRTAGRIEALLEILK